MATIFEFLFKYRPQLFEKGTVAFQPLAPWYLVALLGLFGVMLAFWLYRSSLSLTPEWRLSLIALRAIVMLTLLLTLLQPVLILKSVIPQKSMLAIAYDLSKSMEIQDAARGQSRLDAVRQMIGHKDSPLVQELGAKFKLRFFRFSNTAERTEGFQDVPRHGNTTNLERSLAQIVGEMSEAPLAGIVLATDGADNRSDDLTKAASRLSALDVAVYPVGFGSTGFSKDIELAQVAVPRRVLKDAMLEADVAVRSTGYAGRRAKLVVKEANRAIRSREITLGGDGEVHTYKVTFSVETAGPKVFSFAVEALSDEKVLENNDRTILVRVEDVEPKILYVDGAPRWQYGFLRRAVGDDDNLRLITLLRQADGKFYRQGVSETDPTVLEEGFPVEKQELFEYQAIIIGNVEASFFTFDQLRLISDFVSQRGGGLLMLGGDSAFGQGGYINTPLEDVLPLRIRLDDSVEVPPYRDLSYKLSLTSYGAVHPVTRLEMDEDRNRKRWESVPLLVGFNPTGGAKPGATVLAEASEPDSSGKKPVILAFQRFGKGKSVAFPTDSTWRWRMELDHRDNTHELFWKQMLRWLVTDVPDAVQIESENHSSSLDENVILRAEIKDPSFFRLNNARVTAKVQPPSGESVSIPMTWDVDREGLYLGSFEPIEEGVHEVSVEAYQGAKALGTARNYFRVADSREEYHRGALNADLLERLAAETGGHYYTPDLHGTLAEDVTYVDKGISKTEVRDLWDMPVVFLLLVCAAGLEWFLRKRKGLA